MSEKDKMISGEIYNANYDEELIKERIKVKDKCYEYNNIKPSDIENRTKLMKTILGKHKNNFYIEQPFICDYGLDANKVKFGDNVFIAPNCGFYTAGHPTDYKTRNEGLEYAKPITVGNNVWIGGNVCVLPGVTIGDNVVIGAGSVVNKDIPSNAVAVGNPCKVIKEI